MKKNILKIGLLLAIAIFATSCVRESYTAVKDQTILIYLAGDNDLADETDQKISSIVDAYKSTSDILIYQDHYTTGPKLLKVEADNSGRLYPKVIEIFPAENSASPEVLARVIERVKRDYPANGYGMIFFSHATGWLPQGALTNPANYNPASAMTISTRTVGVDRGTEMSLSDFASAIPNKAFDYIIFEACYMAGVEVAYELREKCDYVVGASTEMVSPGFTDIYPKLLSYLTVANPNLKGLAAEYFKYWGVQHIYKSATISIIKTSELEPLAKLTHTILPADRLFDDIPISGLQLFNRSPKGDRLFFDLGQLLEKYATEQQKIELTEQFEKTVIYKANTQTFLNEILITNHSGLTIYIPQAAYPNLNEAYLGTEWIKAIQ